jgi:hypothetical protein
MLGCAGVRGRVVGKPAQQQAHISASNVRHGTFNGIEKQCQEGTSELLRIARAVASHQLIGLGRVRGTAVASSIRLQLIRQ